MPTVRDLTDPYSEVYVPVPPAGPGICTICHRCISPSFTLCYSCAMTTGQVSAPISLVVPISLCQTTDSQLYHWLKTYKNPNTVESARTRARLHLAATLSRFLSAHGGCIAGAAHGMWDTVTHVPSTRAGRAHHPLEDVIGMAPGLREVFRPLLQAGTSPPSHNQARDDGFVPLPGELLRATHVLLIDDTFTSGARLQSAASSLSRAGATVIAAVAVGRVVDPAFRREITLPWWTEMRKQRFSFDRCCLEAQV
jgi:hypothetical protein